MSETHYGNAMTEIALARAMSFFSIMALTMASTGAGRTQAPEDAERTAIAAADRLGRRGITVVGRRHLVTR